MENKPGRLFHLTKTLGDNGIDLVTLSIADTKDYGIVRFIARDNKKALEVLKNAGFTVGETELIGIEVKDEAGALSRVLGILEKNNISIEYLYSFVPSSCQSAKILLRVEDAQGAVKILEKENISLLSEKIL
jgi:hypothetical protein